MKEWTEIYEQMRGTFAQRAGFVPSEGCDSAVRLYALAAELQSLLMQADWVLDQSFPQTAQGMYLDYHAETRGITRAAAEKAVGTLRFAAADKVTAACPIEKGTVCMTAEGVRFETTEDATIAVGSQWADVPAQAVEAGAGGNVIAGTVTLLSAMPVGVVQCTNPAAFSGGCDAESDEALRGRVLASYQRLPNGANAAYYEQEAMRYPGVAAAKAMGRARGIGTVNVVIATHAGVPDAALLAAVNQTISGCGVRAVAAETDEQGVVRVTFPQVAGEPEDFARIRDIILEIMPCHLQVDFYFRFLTWEECEAAAWTWQGIEDAGHTWESFEKAVPTV